MDILILILNQRALILDVVLQCLAWYPKPNPDTLLAVGLANGKIVLTRLVLIDGLARNLEMGGGGGILNLWTFCWGSTGGEATPKAGHVLFANVHCQTSP